MQKMSWFSMFNKKKKFSKSYFKSTNCEAILIYTLHKQSYSTRDVNDKVYPPSKDHVSIRTTSVSMEN